MKKTKIFLQAFGLFLWAGFFFAFAAVGAKAQEQELAQDQEQEQNQEEQYAGEAVAVATVNIYDSKIVSQDNNNIKLSFQLSNREQVQPDVRYAVQLEKDNSIVDEKIYPETLNIQENQTLDKEVEYVAPQYLKGDYQLWIIAKNKNGLDLAISNPGQITLSGDGQYVEIADCALKVEGEPEDKIYFPEQGVDVKPEENLSVICKIINHADNPIDFTPQFATYLRSTFGEKIETGQSDQKSQTINSQETKLFKLSLPKATKPQAYETVLMLKNGNNQNIYNSFNFHWVLRGLSATIQNLRLDKDSYQKGETAKASFFWSGAADNFPNSRLEATDSGRMLISLEIKNQANQICADLKQDLETGNSAPSYDLPIKTDCRSAKISVSIQDDKGNVLDQREFSTESSVGKIAEAVNEPEQGLNNNIWKFSLIILVILLVASIIAIAVKYRSGRIALFLLVALGSVFGAKIDSVKADTFSVGGHNTYVVNLNKSVFAPNENITASSKGTWSWCANTFGNIASKVTINGTTKTIFNRSWRYVFNYTYDYVNATYTYKKICLPYCSIYDDGCCSYITTPVCPSGYTYDPRVNVQGILDSYETVGTNMCRRVKPAIQSQVDALKAVGYICNSGLFGGGIVCRATWTNGSVKIPAQSVAGSYAAVFGGCDGFENSCSSASSYMKHSIWYTVVGCTGSVPANATMYANDNVGLTASTAYTYSATNTAAKCQYSCKAGYTWNGSSCASTTTYSCSPSLIANATFWPSDNTGLTGDVASTYSATDTAAKCQFSCNTGYIWNGSSCASVTCVPTNPDCAANTCTGNQCDTGCAIVNGIKTDGACCVSNNCEAETCQGDTCVDCGSIRNGTKTCQGSVKPGTWNEVAP